MGAKLLSDRPVGRPVLSEGEENTRKTITIPSAMLDKAVERAIAIDGDFSKYVRRLIEKDLKGNSDQR